MITGYFQNVTFYQFTFQSYKTDKNVKSSWYGQCPGGYYDPP
jgi:hypothetical protein